MASGEVSLVMNPRLIIRDRFFFVVVVEAASHSLKIRATYPQGEGTPYNSEYGIFFFRLQFMPAFIPPPPEKKAVKTDIQGGREKASFC